MSENAGVPYVDAFPATAIGATQDVPEDPEVTAAVAEDNPLGPGHPGVVPGGDQDDGLAPPFREP